MSISSDFTDLETSPIIHRDNSRKVCFKFLNRARRKIELELASHNFVERWRLEEPKPANNAEWEEVMIFQFTSQAIKIRGNSVAMDLLATTSMECSLRYVSVSPDANPLVEQAGPVIYSIELIPPSKNHSEPKKGGNIQI